MDEGAAVFIIIRIVYSSTKNTSTSVELKHAFTTEETGGKKQLILCLHTLQLNLL